jgi:2-polyprenyl-6-methoxyphenol hydroxylase-like FAD-dependent oxidoreductase
VTRADVLIAGGGVAGAAAAIVLGRAGLRVALFEARELGRDKPCGEGLMPSGVEVLDRLGLLTAVGGAPFFGVRYHVRGYSAQAHFPRVAGRRALGLGQRRVLLDRALLEAAASTRGVSTHVGARVQDVLRERNRVVGLRVGDREYRAPLTIGADGASSTIRARLGLSPRRIGGRLGVVTHFKLGAHEEPRPWVEVFVGDGHEFYVTPLPDRRLLVACLMPAAYAGGLRRASRLFHEQLRAHVPLAARLEGATQTTPFMARAPLAVRARSGWRPGALLLGDAAESFDPITGGGMAQALVCCEALAPYALSALEHGDGWLRRFDRVRRAQARDHRLLTSSVLALADRPSLARPFLGFFASHPRLFSHLVGVAAGTRRLFGDALEACEPEQLGDGAGEYEQDRDEGGLLPAPHVVDGIAPHDH